MDEPEEVAVEWLVNGRVLRVAWETNEYTNKYWWCVRVSPATIGVGDKREDAVEEARETLLKMAETIR